MSDIYGLEHQGVIVISKEKHHNINELWYITKNIHKNIDKNELCHIAKAWSSSKELACSYSDELMQKIHSFEESLYFLFPN